MKTKIEIYRGFDVFFDTDIEKFTYSIDDSNYSTKQSYSACKKSIDDYLKENSNFKPFLIRNIESGKVINIIGIRKDKRFIYENESGDKEQLSEYSEGGYILHDASHDDIYKEIEQIKNQQEAYYIKMKKIKEKIKGTPLREYKKGLL